MKLQSLALCALLLSACGEEEEPPQGPLPIVGEYADDFGQDHSVSEANWIITGFGATSVFNTVGYDNATQTIYAHNAADNDFHPGLWSRFDWITFEDELWYCQSVIDGASESVARDPASAADDHAPDIEGCGGYPWSRIRPPFAMRGTYEDNFGMDHVITQTTWTQTFATDVSVFHVTQFDNDAHWAVAQNDSSNAALPDRWSRFDWTENDAGLWYCHGTFDAMTEADALAAAAADASDPATSGCSGYSWSRMTVTP